MADEVETKQSSPWTALIVFGIIFAPGALVTFALWSLFRYGKNRLSVVGVVAIGIATLSAIVLTFTFPEAVKAFSNLDTIGDYAPALITVWVSVSLIIGAPFGAYFVWGEARRLRKNPYLTQLAGSWRYEFKYRNTPLEALRKVKNIKKLKNSLLVESSKAPMGLDENTEEVVFRYDTEARKHTFMTGASGAGKALHANTWIPTKRGFIHAGRVRVGDIIFNELGQLTKVTAVYQPKTLDHFELQLSNGENVRACGDHLWGVREVAGALGIKAISTREIAQNPAKYYISSLKRPIEGTEKAKINTHLLGAWLASGAGSNGLIRKIDRLTRELVTSQDSFIDDLKQLGWLNSNGERIKLDANILLSAVESRERMLESAISIAGAYTLDGQTKLVVTNRSAAEFLRQLVFSLGMQPSMLDEHEESYSFRFKHTNAQVQKKGLFTESIGAITRKKAPLRGTIHFTSVVAIDDNPDNYFCFTVDSPSHLFLFGKSFTPTHNTITMQSLISADIEVGKTVVVIDFKRSPKFAAKLAAWSEENGREFYHFMNGDVKDYDIPLSKGQCFYDPLKSGTPTSKADMVLGMREYDSNAAVYKSAMQQLLQVLFAMLKVADKNEARGIDWTHGGMNQLSSVMSGDGLGELAKACSMEMPSGSTKWTYMKPGAGGINGAQQVNVNTPIAKNAIELVEAMRSKGPLTQARDELQGQMRTIIASEYGQWLTTGNFKEEREIDLFDLTSQDGNVILFSLNSDSEPEFAQYIGSMIFADLTNISALRRNAGSDNQVNIYVDEFQAVPPTAVTALLEKSRESKMALTIAQQSFDQVVASASSAGEAYLNSILDTCSNFIAHAGATEDSATRLAKLLGKKFVTVYSKTNENDSSFMSSNRSRNVDSKVSAREEERWVYGPQEFMKLSSPDPANDYKSSAVWVTKTSADPRYSKKGGATARSIWIIPPERVLVEYYKGKMPEPEERKQRSVTTAERPSHEQPIADIDFDEDESSTATIRGEEPKYDFESYGDEDQDDEDWGMVEITDETPEIEEPVMPIFTPRSAPKQNVPRVETAAKGSMDDLFRSSTPATPVPSKPLVQPLTPTPRATTAALPKQGLPSVRSGLPSRPGGLPTAKAKAKEEDFELPNLDDLQLPEL